MKYEVTDPKGIHIDGRRVAKGEVIRLPDSAARKAFLHFQQVKPMKDSAPKPAAPPGKPPENPQQPPAK